MSTETSCRRLRQGATFFLRLGVFNDDNTIDVTAEAPDASENMQTVLVAAIEDAGSTGLPNYVYECRAVRKVMRPKVRVIKLSASSSASKKGKK